MRQRLIRREQGFWESFRRELETSALSCAPGGALLRYAVRVLELPLAWFEQSVERNQAKNFARFPLHDRHTREPFLRHAVNDRAQRFVRIRGERFFTYYLSQRAPRISTFGRQLAYVSARQHTHQLPVPVDNGQEPLRLPMVGAQRML